MTNPLFNSGAEHVALPLADERALIVSAQAGDQEALWSLLWQYRGLLRKSANAVRSRIRGMSREQIEDLEADLTVAAVEAVHDFDLDRYERLAQTLTYTLKAVAGKMQAALSVPPGTLKVWFKVWRGADRDFDAAALAAPTLGMTTETFRAIQQALQLADMEGLEETARYNGGSPVADEETHHLAHFALDLLTEAEREVVELAYGFRGDPKSDQEVADIRGVSRTNAKKVRLRAVERMRAGLMDEPMPELEYAA